MPSSPNESGPDFGTFGGAGAAGGGIVGTNQLQSAIDKFTQAVDKLSNVASSTSAAGSALGGQGAGGASAFPRPANPFSAATAVAAAAAPAAAGPSVPFPRPVNPFVNPSMPVGATAQPTASTVPPITPTRPGGSSGTGAGAGAGGGGGITAAGVASTAAGAIGAIGGVLGAQGRSSQSAQLALNTLQFQTALGGTSYATTAANALGTVGNYAGTPGKTNQWAFNAPDALQGYALLQQASATPNPYGSAGGRNVLGAMGAVNIANPAASESQNAGMLANLYNPQTSMNMALRGYGATPLQLGTGKQNPLPNVLQPFISQATRGGTTSLKQFSQTLTPGQPGYTTLQNLFPGMSQTQLQSLGSTSQLEYALGSGQDLKGGKSKAGKMNLSQISQLIGTQGLASQNAGQVKKAEATLGQYGFNQSDYQAIKAAAAPGEQKISTTSAGYTKGLQQNTQMMKTLNTTLQKLINTIPGAKGIVGRVEGFMGMGGFGGGSNVVGGGAGVSGTSPNAAAHMKAATASKMTTPSSAADRAVSLAQTQVGVPYAYGKEQPGQGFDCSALPQWAYKAAGIALPRTAVDQYAFLKNNLISTSAAIEGDLVFSAGPGASMHEAMVTDQGRHVIEAKGVGTQIQIGPYNPKAWKYAARPTKGTSKNRPAKGASGTNVKGGGAASGAAVASFAEKYDTGLNHPYLWGGNSPTSGWDCSGFASYVYGHFGFNIPRTTEAMWSNTSELKKTTAQPGALVLEAGSDGTVGNPGHVGIYISSGKMVAAADPAVGTINERPQGVSGYMIPKNGWTSSGGGGGGGGGASGAAIAAVLSGLTAGGGHGGGLGTPGAGTGDDLTGGSVAEMAAFGGAVTGSASGGSGATTASANTAAAIAALGAGGSSSTGANATGTTSGTMSASAISAMWTKDGGPAGAAANMARIAKAESGDNPSIVQKGQPAATTGYGLYQITPTSGIKQNGQFGNLLNADNNTRAAISLFKASGYSPWSSDPIGAGLSGRAAGGSVNAGATVLVGEKGPELATFATGGTVYNASDSVKMMNNAMAQPAGFNYSQAHPAYAGSGSAFGASRGGGACVTVNCNITMSGSSSGSPTAAPGGTSAAGMSVTGYEGAAAAQAFAKQLKIELAKLNLAAAIGTGVTS